MEGLADSTALGFQPVHFDIEGSDDSTALGLQPRHFDGGFSEAVPQRLAMQTRFFVSRVSLVNIRGAKLTDDGWLQIRGLRLTDARLTDGGRLLFGGG